MPIAVYVRHNGMANRQQSTADQPGRHSNMRHTVEISYSKQQQQQQNNPNKRSNLVNLYKNVLVFSRWFSSLLFFSILVFLFVFWFYIFFFVFVDRLVVRLSQFVDLIALYANCLLREHIGQNEENIQM